MAAFLIWFREFGDFEVGGKGEHGGPPLGGFDGAVKKAEGEGVVLAAVELYDE